MEIVRSDLRNIAIVAHVDHGKTTLVDAMLSQTGTFRDGQPDRPCVMDSDAQERERGITILAKNCAVIWGGVRVNIIDTPGHADFGGEVERILRMADGALLLVDAAEGPMPQTRFVLRRALTTGLKIILVVNKIDRKGADPVRTVDAVFDLMVELGAEDWQLDFPVLYGVGREGWMSTEPMATGGDLAPLFRAVIDHVPPPAGSDTAPLQLQVANIAYSEFVGRMAVGRIHAGQLATGTEVTVVPRGDGIPRRGRVLQIHGFSGLGREEIRSARIGDIVQVTGLERIDISDTICDVDAPVALPPIPIDEPTIRMTFAVNTGPLSGLDGKPLQSRDLSERLRREAERDVALRVHDTDQPDVFEVHGRGLLHLSVMAEKLRREGLEFLVGSPRVIEQIDARGRRLEPIELAVVDVPEDRASRVISLMLERRGELRQMNGREGIQHLEFLVPSRGLLGLRSTLLSATGGEAVLHAIFDGYGPHRGDIERHRGGAIVSQGSGEAVAYAIWVLQDRGTFFVDAGDAIFEGMVVGEHAKETDLVVNLTRSKKLTNIRNAGGVDDAIRLVPPRRFSLEEVFGYIGPEEMVELTPHHIRLRKRYLRELDRRRERRS